MLIQDDEKVRELTRTIEKLSTEKGALLGACTAKIVFAGQECPEPSLSANRRIHELDAEIDRLKEQQGLYRPAASLVV